MGDPLVVTLSNTDLTPGGQWSCSKLKDVVDVAKWNYYVARTLRYLEAFPIEP